MDADDAKQVICTRCCSVLSVYASAQRRDETRRDSPKRRRVARRDAGTAARGAGHGPRLPGLVAHGRQAVRVLVDFERVLDVAQRPRGRGLRHAHAARHVHPRVGVLLFVRLQREHRHAACVPHGLERDLLRKRTVRTTRYRTLIL